MGYQGHALDGAIIHRWTVPTRVCRTIRPDTLERHRRHLHSGGDDVFTRVGDLWIPTTAVRDPGVVRWGARGHPRGIGYDLEALTRMRLAHVAHPDWTGAAWTAAAVWGMPYFCDDADTCVLSGGDRRLATHAGEVTRHRRAGWMAVGLPVAAVDPEFPSLQVTSPVVTIVHCLRSLRAGEHRWPVPPGTGLDDVTVRSVQFLDAACRLFGIDPSMLPGACAGLFPRRELRRLAALADRGGESPMETVLRLQIRDICGDQVAKGFVSQLVVFQDGSIADPVHTGERTTGRVVARVDLGCAELKLALQYDGADHLARSRRDRDSRVGTDLANADWHVLRLTWGHLTDRELLRQTVTDGIAVARRRLR
ncbi:hypothetical protein PQI66_10815 [Corynebacterium sp. USCH3]|uniref:hypothetical protein n=1 Tax=Corynebacterium sp. USCH3 TaxID=3024840 RepID=UPI00309B5C11